MITAGIDVGSNSVRMLIADVQAGKIVKKIYSGRALTRLSAGIEKTGKLSPAGVEKTLDLFKTFAENIKKYKADKVIAVATSAVREASDSVAFLSKAAELGIPLIAISGEQEAYYTYKGVVSSMAQVPSPALVYDIGGGSTEFIYVKDGQLLYNISVPIGVVKLSDKFGFQNITDASVHKACKDYLLEKFNDVAGKISTFEKPKVLIGVAGSVTTIAAVDAATTSFKPDEIEGYVLRQDNIAQILTTLCAMTGADRLKVAGVEAGREDLIPAGIIAIQVIMSLFNQTESHVSVYGLREGVTIAAEQD
ncbi:exopolyphosphatase [Deferribacterales bacterium RsTz2092]|nr:exopolyphosphatase [Deferribacterales bacterium]